MHGGSLSTTGHLDAEALSAPRTRVARVALALYRTYRPGRLDDVVGQEHVTTPLKRALAHDRIHHAYLFSGPRGCGKTSTARIMARSLNCAQGPTPEPCGVCDSCVDLAPNGPGSLDVIEMDAASHGGVDDTRDLRERAMFAPASSRYKIYIIDEAHMVSPAGFNALLKLVEEPPEHIRFIFATTEADKVLPTIRSRTHHYTFRLVPTRLLQTHLAMICDAESVPYDPAALALIARAGAGSVRDALSVLGQLVAGAGEAGLTYEDVVGQLGVTDTVLLDRLVDALIAGDGSSLFGTVDQVVEVGHDPRRFVTDLLQRLRDLVVLCAVPGAAKSGLLNVPAEQVDTMARQAEALGLAALSRAADLVSVGLSELKGATAPRLQLELLCARLLLPPAGDPSTLLARLDRMERRVAGLSVTGGVPPDAGARPAVEGRQHHQGPPRAPRSPTVEASGAGAGAGVADGADVGARSEPGAQQDRQRDDPQTQPTPAEGRQAPSRPRGSGGPPRRPPVRSAGTAALGSSTESSATGESGPASSPAVTGSGAVAVDRAGAATEPAATDLTELRAAWPAVLDALRQRSRVAWMAFENSVALSLTGRTLAVSVPHAGVLTGIRAGGRDEQLRQALLDVARLDVVVEVVVDPGARTPVGRSPAGPSEPEPPTPSSDPGPDRTGETGGHRTSADRSAHESTAQPGHPAPAEDTDRSAPAEPGDADSNTQPDDPRPSAGSTRRPRGRPSPAAPPAPEAADVPAEDDEDAEPLGLSAVDLAMRELGATPIGEIEHG